MSTRKGLSIGGPVVVVVAIAAALLWPAPARTVTITVAAPPETKVTGSYEVDGVQSTIDAEAPAEFVVTGRSVTFSVRKDDRPGQMTIRIAVEGRGYASASAVAGGGVRGGFKSGNGVTRSESFWATNSQAGP
jgi:hypothetical protein